MGCWKIGYRTRAQAAQAVKLTSRSTRFGTRKIRENVYPLEPYYCRDCQKWHIGHRKP